MKNLPTLDSNHIGVPIYWPNKELPGPSYAWMLGQTFDKVIYPELAKRYPSGRLPDPRWDFFRIVGTDQQATSRQGQSVQPLSFAGNALPSHQHVDGYRNNVTDHRGFTYGAHHYGTQIGYTPAGINSSPSSYGSVTSPTSPGTPSGSVIGTGNETRPQCMLWHCITRTH